eukprot:Transcript_31554.p3 GENE.Transcript_31554~~Transcript_31554.p3  ORF type:complete len:96 (-),score=4.03 Transcript_31554:208-495(-)
MSSPCGANAGPDGGLNAADARALCRSEQPSYHLCEARMFAALERASAAQERMSLSRVTVRIRPGKCNRSLQRSLMSAGRRRMTRPRASSVRKQRT